MQESSPAIAYGKAFVGTEDGRLYCIGSWGQVPGDNIGKGVLFLAVAALLFVLLWRLGKLKKPSEKKQS
jgi:hypothetical protein